MDRTLVQTVVYGTLVNVVRVEQLWPRSVTRRDLGRGDQRAAELSAARAALLERSASPAPTSANARRRETIESSRHVREPSGHVGGDQSRPWHRPMLTASARDVTASLRKMLRTWDLRVFTETYSAAAISR